MFLFEFDWTPYADLSYIESNYEYQDCFNRTARMTEDGIEQFGYIDIKQHPKVKGRKLKSWKKKWVVLHEMSIRSAGRTAAKVDVYTDEATAIKSPADKVTFILEYVTDVRVAKSKKHDHAFEIVESEPVLLLAGSTEYETQTWLMAFKKIFWPDQIEKDEFTTTIIQNEHTKRLMLEGHYKMIIKPEAISIQSATCNSYEWSLRMLRRFNQENHPDFPTEDVLTIECGPKSECGEAKFQFRVENVTEILAAIKRNIFKAVNNKKSESPCQGKPVSDKPWRTSVTSTTSDESQRLRSSTLDSEQKYRELLESPMQESKRKRLNSESSEQSRRSSEDSMSIVPKKSLSVTFEDEKEKDNTTVDELLGSADYTVDEEDEYNRLDLSGRRLSGTNANIITTFTVAQPGYQTKVLLDDRGYSHVGISANGPMIEDDKSRSLSNISSQSAMSFRSDSTNSGDSGCLQESNKKDRVNSRTHRSTNSFDSAVSTSSTVDQSDSSMDKLTNKTQITVEIQELEMTAEELAREQTIDCDSKNEHSNIYQDVEIESEFTNKVNKTANDSQALVKSRSCSDFNATENHYEELENYRKGKKNLVKHLGMDPKMDPSSIPPALPERPLSHKMKRKFKHSEKKLFTLPFAKNKNKKDKGRARSGSSSSESDADESKYREELSISAWPLGNKSVTVGNSDIYQPVNIERYLNDDQDNIAPTKRERSSSLNLNTSTQMRRPSEVAEKSNLRWRHNRNVSMNVDLLQRMKDSDTAELNTAFNTKLENTNYLETIDSSDMICDKSIMSEKQLADDDEPIYAEVQPLKKDNQDKGDEPFPDIDSWQPHSPRVSRKCLDDTYYENDPLNKSNESDILNEGFVMTDTNQVDDLIDLSFDNTTSSSENRTSKTAVELFALGNNNSVFHNNNREIFQTQNTSSDLLDIFDIGVMTPLPVSTSNLVPNNTKMSSVLNETVGQQNYSVNQTHESVYMDMTSCKNESIYVMPSSLKNSEK